jgi:hypothetical protein
MDTSFFICYMYYKYYLTLCALPFYSLNFVLMKEVLFFFFLWNWGLNTGLQSCKVGTLPLELLL